MKTFRKDHCPDAITYLGHEYKRNMEATEQFREGKSLPGSPYNIKVSVLSKKLRGKTDLHDKPYEPNIFIYSSELGVLRNNLPVKEVFYSRKFKKWLPVLHTKV